MTAAKHTDPIVGMDQHLVQPPGPVPPIMVPIPVAGMILDPADYQPGACTVFINGLPRARAGSVCMMCPPHIPIGGVFVMPPLSEAELYQGSSTVTVDGEAASAMGHQVLGCHDIGAPAPARSWKSSPAKSLMKAGSVVLPIPAGAPVSIGGSPTTAASRNVSENGGERDLVVTITDQFGAALPEIRIRVSTGQGTAEGTSDAEGRVRIDKLLVARTLVTFNDLRAEVERSVGDEPLPEPMPTPPAASAPRVSYENPTTWCDVSATAAIVVDVPTLRTLVHLDPARTESREDVLTLATDDDGATYSRKVTLATSKHVTHPDAKTCLVTFRALVPGETYSLRIEPKAVSGSTEDAYFVFRRMRLPQRPLRTSGWKTERDAAAPAPAPFSRLPLTRNDDFAASCGLSSDDDDEGTP